MVVKTITILSCCCLALMPLVAYYPLPFVTAGTEGLILLLYSCIVSITAALSGNARPLSLSPAIPICGLILCAYLLLRTDVTTGSQPDKALVMIPAFAGLLFALPILINQTNTRRLLINIITLITLFESILGLLQFAHFVDYKNTDFIAGGSMMNPAVYGNFLSLVIPFLFAVLLLRKQAKTTSFVSALLTITLLSGMAAVMISSARTSWIAIAAGITVVLLYHYRQLLCQHILHSRKLTLITAMSFITIVAMLMMWLLQYKSASTSGRMFIYRQSLSPLAANPITGVGLNKFGVAYNLAQAEYFKQSTSDKAEILHADNINIAPGEWLQLSVEAGLIGVILGLLAFAVLLFILIKQLRSADEAMIPLYIGGIGTLVALFYCMLFSYPLHTYPVVAILLLILSVPLSDTTAIRQYPAGVYRQWIAKGVLVAVCSVALNWQLRIGNAERKWLHLQHSTFWLNYKAIKPEYEQLLHLLDSNFEFLSDYASLAYQNGDYQTSLRVLNKGKRLFSSYLAYMYAACCYQQLKDTDKAFTQFNIACNMAPNRFLPKYRFFLFLVEQKRFREAAILRQEINSLPVKVPGKEVSFIKDKVNEVVLL
ncbi:O-antigen ligase family protein [Chitinophaga rhizophila]|uniref:O-antigen ligase family protein n=1 Tax=Chitinophaga rhizophila TaxID=2866212 RepID=A0ABS7GGY5_9BACT|nr:O-antigen ligase family protein [Chitinophaga rhizophila]MBW8686390.1 O-antigen ligase family protein [Chitinophaga rhizophila]